MCELVLGRRASSAAGFLDSSSRAVLGHSTTQSLLGKDGYHTLQGGPDGEACGSQGISWA